MAATSANDLMPLVLDYVATSSAASEKLAAEVNTHRSNAEKRAAAIPETLKALVDSGCVPPGREKQAQEMLEDPVAALGLLKFAADKIGEQTDALEKVVEKSASVPSLGAGVEGNDGAGDFDVRNTPFIGAHTAEKKASDRVFEGILDDPFSGR